MVGIIIQARMGSSRLPGKVLLDFGGKTLLGHILYRLEKITSIVKIIVATSDFGQDDLIERFCKNHQVDCFRGEEQNVLKRYYDCATKYNFNNIVRMTADNPFPDIEELDRLIRFHLEKGFDFSENLSTLPIGVGTEIMSYSALKQSLENASLPKHYEHVDEYILDNLSNYKHGILSVPEYKNRPKVRLTVDTWKDYEKACYIIARTNSEYITTKQAIELSIQYENEQRYN